MSAFEEGIARGFAEFIQGAQEVLTDAVSDLAETEGFDDRLAAAAYREAVRYAEDEFGHPPELHFGDEFDFFDEYLRTAYQVGGGSQDAGWCRYWWDHPAALMRIRAMWHAYEVRYRNSPADCDETFLREVGDHHMGLLMGEKSPMKACQTGHKPSRQLKSAPIDEGVKVHATPE